nr:retron Ec67 family RNA-directed DNA polymerase/endonuclease [Verticiella sp. GG226]
MSQLIALRNADTRREMAALLGYESSKLTYALHGLKEESRYTQFAIPKKNGGHRTISAPDDATKALQRKLAALLANCVREIRSVESPRLPGQRRGVLSHGFEPGLSIITNARVHRKRRWVFNIDLADFFDSIHFGRVRGYFENNRNFQLKPIAALVIAQIACFKSKLPQGSPSSPVIANLVASILDIHLSRLATQVGCSYTRYADDLTFSTNQEEFPSAIAHQVDRDSNRWEASKELVDVISRSGFKLNSRKTRMQYRHSRQEVTGLVVNRVVNVPSEYRREVRARVHRLITKGEFYISGIGEAGQSTQVAGTPAQLRGMLAFIDRVDLFNLNLARESKGEPPITPASDLVDLTRNEETYRKFLYFTEFYATPLPLVICEGSTDYVYLVHAIRALVDDFPELAYRTGDEEIKFKIRFYRYPRNSTRRLTRIRGGTADLKKFVATYGAEVQRFKAGGQQHPVIVDNDAAGREVYGPAKKLGVVFNKSRPLTRVSANLYLTATPLLGADESCIESLFKTEDTARLVDGKSFDPDDKADRSLTYSKAVFAHQIVAKHAAHINFDRFRPLLASLSDAVTMHRESRTEEVAPAAIT